MKHDDNVVAISQFFIDGADEMGQLMLDNSSLSDTTKFYILDFFKQDKIRMIY